MSNTNKVNWNDDKIKSKFIEMYQKIDLGIYVYTFDEIAKEFGVKDRSTIRNAVKRYKLEKRDIKLYNRKDGLTYKDRIYIMNNYKEKTEKQLSEYIGKSERIIIEFLKTQNVQIKRNNPRSKKEIFMDNKEFLKDYNNLFLSNAYIGKKYNIYQKTIKIWREQDFGNYNQQINKIMKKTTPECLFEDILYQLGIPFLYQYNIDKWNIDYYLGRKLCVEVNGDYWHKNSNYVINKDFRKRNNLKEKGYILIEFTETEIKNNQEYIKTTLLENIASLDRNI